MTQTATYYYYNIPGVDSTTVYNGTEIISSSEVMEQCNGSEIIHEDCV